jgi:hypothetical protein
MASKHDLLRDLHEAELRAADQRFRSQEQFVWLTLVWSVLSVIASAVTLGAATVGLSHKIDKNYKLQDDAIGTVANAVQTSTGRSIGLNAALGYMIGIAGVATAVILIVLHH